MLKKYLLLVLLLLFCRTAKETPDLNSWLKDFTLGEPAVWQEISLVPIIWAPAKIQPLALAQGKYPSLSETDKKYTAVNNSRQPLLILAGEFFENNGQQFMAGQDALLYPQQEGREIALFPSAGNHPSASLAAYDIRALLQLSSVPTLSMNEPKIRYFSRKAVTLYLKPRTADVKEGEGELRQIYSTVCSNPKTCGLIVAYKNNILAIDIFATPTLFADYQDKLYAACVELWQNPPEYSNAPKAFEKVFFQTLQEALYITSPSGEQVFSASFTVLSRIYTASCLVLGDRYVHYGGFLRPHTDSIAMPVTELLQLNSEDQQNRLLDQFRKK